MWDSKTWNFLPRNDYCPPEALLCPKHIPPPHAQSPKTKEEHTAQSQIDWQNVQWDGANSILGRETWRLADQLWGYRMSPHRQSAIHVSWCPLQTTWPKHHRGNDPRCEHRIYPWRTSPTIGSLQSWQQGKRLESLHCGYRRRGKGNIKIWKSMNKPKLRLVCCDPYRIATSPRYDWYDWSDWLIL